MNKKTYLAFVMKKWYGLPCFLLWVIAMKAQDTPLRYIEPAFRIKYTDARGTYIQCINYFDRELITQNSSIQYEKEGKIYSKNIVYQGTKADIHAYAGMKVDLILDDFLKIPDVVLLENKTARIEIRDIQSFLKIEYKNALMTNETDIQSELIQQDDTVAISIPSMHVLKPGGYLCIIHTLPEIRFFRDFKPGEYAVHRIPPEVELGITNIEKIKSFSLLLYDHKTRQMEPCYNYVAGQHFEPLKVLSNKKFVIRYVKKGSKKFRYRSFHTYEQNEINNLILK